MKIQTGLIIGLIFIILIGTIIYKFKNPTVITKTETRIDTSYVQLPPETIIKEKLVTKYVQDPRILDSLEQYKKFYSDLQDSLSVGKLLVVRDTTKFASGDSLQTEYIYYPINKFKYEFFARPDKIVNNTTTITNTVDKTSLFTFNIGGGLSADASKYNSNGQINTIVPELMGSLEFRKSKFSPYLHYAFNQRVGGGILYKLKLF
jgi:uncharacterized membrane-anchored protein YhcB (DUF1043 family)